MPGYYYFTICNNLAWTIQYIHISKLSNVRVNFLSKKNNIKSYFQQKFRYSSILLINHVDLEPQNATIF